MVLNPSAARREIVLADGQALTALGMRYLIEKESDINVHEVHERETLFNTVLPSTVLTIVDYLSVRDFTITDLNELKLRNPETPVLVVTSDRNEESILQVLEGDVSGFLFKDCFEDEIMRAVNAVLAGEKFYCNKVFEILMAKRRQVLTGESYATDLTTREIEIIRLVVTGNSTVTIAEKLNLSHHTISTHRKNIIKKLKIKSPVELVTYAYDRGWIQTK